MVRVNFFKKIWLAITDFRLFPYTQKERAICAIWYFIRLILLCSLIIAAFLTKYVFDTLPGIIAKFDEVVPDFSISDGQLETSEEKYAEIDSDTYLVFSKDHKSDEILDIIRTIKSEKSSIHDYSGYLFVLSDQASYVYDMDDAIYQAVKFDYSNFTEPTTKNNIVSDISELDDSFLSKCIVFAMITIALFIAISFNRVMTSFVYAITIWLLNTIFTIKLKFRNYIIIICYVSTLPIILETIAIIVTKTISNSVNLICTLISFVYIFYALRAMKIDYILSKGIGKNPLEKLENAIKEAQDEIEEQLKEKAEKEEKEIEEETKDDNKDEDNKEDKDD